MQKSLVLILVLTACLFASGCTHNEIETPSNEQGADNGQKVLKIGNLDVIPNLEAGKDIEINGTVTNIGTEKAPDYMVCINLTNNGNSDFDCRMAFSSFLLMDEKGSAAAEQQGIDTTIINMDPRGLTRRIIKPGYGTSYAFESGSNTTALARLNHGYLRYNFMVFKPIEESTSEKQLKEELLIFTASDLPTVLEVDGNEASLKPGETQELVIERA